MNKSIEAAQAAAASPAHSQRRRAAMRRRHGIRTAGLLCCALLLAQALSAAPAHLHVETCTAAAQSCVGPAEAADAWLPPGAGLQQLRQLVQALHRARGLPADAPVLISCSSGAPDAELLQGLAAAGWRVQWARPD